jgi:hypothetical protein
LREEGRQLGHIPIDALDQFARRVVVMEMHVKTKRMPGKLLPQGIGGRPGDILPEVGHTDGDNLLQQCDTYECQGSPGQYLQCLTCQRRIDERPHDLRSDNLQADAAK